MRARLRWLRPEEGGRRSLPTGPRYVAPARIQGVATSWPSEAWSLVVTFDPATPLAHEMDVSVELLAPDAARAGLLTPGTSFELHEGRACVVVGVVG